MTATAILWTLLALGIGMCVGIAVGHARATSAAFGRHRADLARSAERESQLREQLAHASAAAHTDDQLLEVFRSVSSQTMAEQSRQLLQLAETRYRTIEQSSELRWAAQGESVVTKLGEYAQRLAQLEQQRQRESAVLGAAVQDLRASNEQIRTEARSLASAMKDNRVRGTWGEVQLRRVLESSGMIMHADFTAQRGVSGGDTSGRPDVVVRLPNDRCVVIDAKAPLDRYLEAVNCEDPVRREELVAEHAKAVAGHVSALSRRRYEDMVDGAVDFVVMFIPGDAFLSAAFEARPGLFEEAAAQDVILASPGTLLAFLRGVACGWQERQVAESAAAIAALGRELHERVALFADHFTAVGGALGKAVGSYNQALGSMERRLLVTARRFEDHGAASRRPLPVSLGLDELPAEPSAIELVRLDDRTDDRTDDRMDDRMDDRPTG